MRSLNNPTLLKKQAFINGTFVGEPVNVVTSSATGEPIGADEAERAVDAAANA